MPAERATREVRRSPRQVLRQLACDVHASVEQFVRWLRQLPVEMRDALMKVREEHVRQMQVNASYRRELLGFASAVIAVVGRMAPWHAIIAAIVAIYVAIYSRNDHTMNSSMWRDDEW